MFIGIPGSIHLLLLLVRNLNLCFPTSKLCVKITFVCFYYIHSFDPNVFPGWEQTVPSFLKVFFFFLKLVSPKTRFLTFMLAFNYLLSAHQLTDNMVDAMNQEIKNPVCSGEGMHSIIPCGKCSQKVLIKDWGNREKGNNWFGLHRGIREGWSRKEFLRKTLNSK